MLKNHLIFFIISLNIIHGQTEECQKTEENKPITEEKRLRDDLLCNYNKHFIPVHNRSEEMYISMEMHVTDYDIMQQTTTELLLNMKITLTWTDIFLTWYPQDYNSMNEIVMSTNDIWSPVILPEEVDFFKQLDSILEDTECKVTSSGLVTCVIDAYHSGACTTDDTRWPYNEYHCHVQYMVFMFSNEQVTIDWPNVVNETLTIEEPDKDANWIIKEKGSGYYQGKPQKGLGITEMYFEFEVVENVKNKMVFWFVAMFVVTSLSLTSFWANFESSDRVILCLINMISHVWNLQNFEWQLERIGHTVPLILCYFRDSMVMAFIILVETMVFKTILLSEKPIPRWLISVNRLLDREIVRKILCINRTSIADFKDASQASYEDDLKFIKESYQLEKKRIIEYIDRIIFMVFLLTYIIMGITIMNM